MCLLLFIFFFSFIFISWRLISLQHCSGFFHTLTWISHGFLNVSPLNSDSCPDVGIGPLLRFPGPVLLTLQFFPSLLPPPEFVWFCVFFSCGQLLLSALSWCSACTSVSEGVFLMYPWREMFSISTYSSAILFSLAAICCFWWYRRLLSFQFTSFGY